MDEIPSTLGFNSQMFKAKDVELPNLGAIVVISFDEIPLPLGVDSKMPCSLVVKVSPFHVIFNLNKVLITTHFDRGSYTVLLRHGLKELLEKCLVEF